MSKVEPEDSVATLKQLAATDLELVRVIEDLIRALADRDILDEGAHPIRIRRLWSTAANCAVRCHTRRFLNRTSARQSPPRR